MEIDTAVLPMDTATEAAPAIAEMVEASSAVNDTLSALMPLPAFMPPLPSPSI